ncbi:hypothetical protein [Simonsiella muelleri]|uniref:hypothetical protein n=1 Tax=Simonsiella muelleri TaxID=72 RepID=UPI0028D38E55|nr:hypothetical protein [Simonsiella muelleri]
MGQKDIALGCEYRFSDGYELDISAVQKLVQAMSAFQPQATNVTNGSVSHKCTNLCNKFRLLRIGSSLKTLVSCKP